MEYVFKVIFCQRQRRRWRVNDPFCGYQAVLVSSSVQDHLHTEGPSPRERVNVCCIHKVCLLTFWLIALYPGRNTATPRLQQEHYSVNMSLFVNADQTFSCQKRHRFSPVTHVWLQLPEETLLTCSVSLDWLGFWCNSAPIAWWGIRVCTEWSDLMALGGLRSGSLFLFYGLSRAAGSTSSRRTLIIASHLLGHWLLAAFGNGILHIMSPKYPYQSWMRWWTLCS